MTVSPDIPLYQLNTFSPESPFLISYLKVSEDVPVEVESNHRHNYYSICLVLKGTFSHTIDFEQHLIHAPAIVMIAPGQIHKVGNTGHGSDELLT